MDKILSTYKTLIYRATTTCDVAHLQKQLDHLQSVEMNNGYLCRAIQVSRDLTNIRDEV